ncbi:MAG TPA: hypothetical protein VN088_06240 [Nocardioides sp.]|nr:hypothetical protein [Nocardioides sp.]
MSLPPRHKVAAALMVTGFAVNLDAGRRGLRTICTAGREHAHVDEPLGLVLSLGAIAGAAVGFAVHFLDPEKRPIR